MENTKPDNDIENKSEKEQDGNAGGAQFQTFEEFLTSQTGESVKPLYEASVAGLKSALDKEREDRRRLSEQVKKLSSLAEKGSELERQLSETETLLEQAEKNSAELQKRAKFAEQAIRPEVSCANIRAAYALAQSENLFKEDGVPEWEKLRELAPELFRSANQTDAGQRTPSKPSDINSAIRKAAGYNR